ncbi:MAG: type I polyketide synthase, partial [Nitrospirota bacterium]
MREDSHSTAIAITGMACQYPGAKDLRNFWENILAKRRQFRPFPDIRLPLSDYYDPDPDTPDKTYCNKAALIDGFKFDWAGHRIPKSTIDSTDIAHWLALEVAIRSLKDAGFNRENVPIEKSGVILGNTLTGEQTRAEGLRLRWPFIKRTLETAAKTKGLSQQTISDLLQTMEVYYKSIFAPVTEDTLSGGLSNTISGRICNYLDFHGGGYTVDGACSSSLLAIATAATALTNGDLDLAMAGGVDISLDAFEMIGFAKTAALTKKDMRVYDRRASGFIPGEGCGFVVLKRLEDAIADGNYIYAVLRGWGISSDGKGGLTAPSVKGQAAALQRAYERAGYTPGDLDFIEGHGTGTVVGDKTELEAISLAMGDIKKTDLRHCGITSLKSIIGHTKAASGIGGFIKAAIAVNRRILPPTANCSEPNEVFESSVPSVYPIMSGEIRLPEEKLKAGVSAMGFGGINCHVTIESGDQPSESLVPSIEERKLLVSHQETELFVLSASSASELLKRTQTIKQRAQGLPESELVDLAAQITNELEPNVPVRSAVIAGTPEKLSECLQNLEKMLVENPPLEGETVISPQQDIFIGNTVQKSRVGFLFPGQGSQFLNMGKALVERHEWAQKLLANAAIWIEKNGSKDIAQFIFRPTDRAINVNNIKQWSSLLKQTEIAQPAICLSSLLWIHKLARLGIRPVVAGGHSLGELTAFHAAGAFDESALLKLASTRGKAMAAPGDERGIMASLGCSQESAIDVLNRVKGYAVIANINSTRQIVISGERTGVEEAVNIAKGKGIRTHILAVSNAFHSRFVSSAAERLRNIAPIPKKLASTKTKLISGMNGREIKEGINLQDHFADQVLSQVDFVSLVKKMAKDCDLMLEVGPGRVLSDLANTIIQDDNIMCRPTESKQGKDRDLNVFLGNFFVHGGNVKWEALYRDRFVRPFVPSSERIFIENPCERPYKVPDTEHLTFSGDRGLLGAALADKINISPQELTDYLSSRHQFIEAVIKADMENMPSATLTSLSRQDNLESVDTITKEKQTEKIEDISRDTTSTSGLLFELVEKRTGFPKDSLSAELRLLDDLNLDSIKAAELIAEASMRLGVAGETDVSKYANATLKEIADVFDQLKKDRSVPAESVSAAEVKTDKPSWVRNFVVKPVVQELSPVDLKGEANNWKESKVLILSEPEEQSIARTLSKQLINHGAEVYTALFEDIRIQGLSGNDKYTGYIAILPRASNQVGLNSSRLESIIDRLRTIALLPSDTENNESRETVAYIQFGGGYFGTEPEVSGIEQCTTLALAASLHLERPDLKVRVLDFSTEIQTAQLAGKIIEELSTSDNYAAAGYDKKLTRRVPKPYLSEPVDYKPRPVSWSSDDVILITGGAKGITAECSLSLAQTTNVRVALIGSSPHPGENSDNGGEIAQTLKRFGDSGLTAKYYQCDIVNPGAVDSVVKRIQKELGDIGGVIHGSALNKPGNLDKVSTEDALKEVAPKVLGTVNLCNALKDSPPKLFAGFSSIIGISGMIRNAWYGFSNEALNLLLCRFAKEHPETSVLSIAFSIWDDVGMGVRMGSTKYLAQMGIGAIPAKEGVRRFLQLIMNDPGEKQVIVAARIANLDTLQPHLFPLPKSSRFLEKIIYYYPKVEIISRAHLSLDRDTYIKDHLWRGTYLFPTVFGLEAMSQAVAYVTGENNFNSICIEDISLERPIPVNPESGVEIEIRAEVLERKTKKENRRVRVGISTAQTGFAVDHFSALFILKVDQEAPQEKVELPRAPLEIQPDKDLYNGKLLFQGPQFQRIKQIYSLDSKKCVFRSKITFFKEHKSDDAAHSWLLGDPFFRDSLLHSAQIAIPRDICLPLKIESIERYHVEGNLPGSLIGIAIIEDLIDRDYLVTVSAINENGKVVERLKGYILRILEHHEDYPAAEEIANPGTRDERIIREEIKKRAESLGLLLPEISSDYLPGLHQLTKNERHKKELPVVHEAIKRTQQIR